MSTQELTYAQARSAWRRIQKTRYTRKTITLEEAGESETINHDIANSMFSCIDTASFQSTKITITERGVRKFVVVTLSWTMTWEKHQSYY